MMRNIAVAVERIAVAVIVTAFIAQSSVSSPPARAAADAPGEVPGFEAASPPRPLPEVSFTDAAGKALTLGDFRGRVVLLNFWATWCAPCVREMPSLDRLEGALGGPRFEVVALSQDRGGAAVVDKFFARLGIRRLGRYSDPTMRGAVALGVVGLPTTILIDARGYELGRVLGPAEWDSDAALHLIRRHLDPPATRAGAG